MLIKKNTNILRKKYSMFPVFDFCLFIYLICLLIYSVFHLSCLCFINVLLAWDKTSTVGIHYAALCVYRAQDSIYLLWYCHYPHGAMCLFPNWDQILSENTSSLVDFIHAIYWMIFFRVSLSCFISFPAEKLKGKALIKKKKKKSCDSFIKKLKRIGVADC